MGRQSDLKAKDNEEKEFKKFVTQFVAPYLEEVKHTLKINLVDSTILAECLNIINQDIESINRHTKSIKNSNLLEKCTEILAEALRAHLNSQIFTL